MLKFVNFMFLKLDKSWDAGIGQDRKGLIEEFSRVLKSFRQEIIVRTYTLVGLREEADFLVWIIGDEPSQTQRLAEAIRRTRLGRHLNLTVSYVATLRESPYAVQQEREPAGLPKPGEAKYLFVYPFVRTREWYLKPFEERMKLMREHIAVGAKFPSVRINTSYSFGVDDQDFTLAFETDSFEDFQNLVMRLRETEISRYTVRDTPMFTCINKPIEEILDSILPEA